MLFEALAHGEGRACRSGTMFSWRAGCSRVWKEKKGCTPKDIEMVPTEHENATTSILSIIRTQDADKIGIPESNSESHLVYRRCRRRIPDWYNNVLLFFHSCFGVRLRFAKRNYSATANNSLLPPLPPLPPPVSAAVTYFGKWGVIVDALRRS